MTDDDEVALPGGNVGGAVRVGDTVRRPTGPWTPAVHELLGFLADAGLDRIPHVLGVDDRGREVLTYLPGAVLPVLPGAMSDAQVGSAMRWLRRYHEAVIGFPRGPHRWRFVERALADGEIVCHHDVAVYNLAFDGESLSGVFDWDVAGPGVPLDDLAMFAWNDALMHDDPRWVADRLALQADAYGGVDPVALLDHVIVRMTAAARRIEAGQRAGDPGMLRLAEAGEPTATRTRLTTRAPLIATARALLLPGNVRAL